MNTIVLKGAGFIKGNKRLYSKSMCSAFLKNNKGFKGIEHIVDLYSCLSELMPDKAVELKMRHAMSDLELRKVLPHVTKKTLKECDKSYSGTWLNSKDVMDTVKYDVSCYYSGKSYLGFQAFFPLRKTPINPSECLILGYDDYGCEYRYNNKGDVLFVVPNANGSVIYARHVASGVNDFIEHIRIRPTR